MLARLERGQIRNLRHDFRTYYHVRYEDVGFDEAVDLIQTLPSGSLWRGSRSTADEWSEERYLMAEAIDALNIIASGMRYTESPERVERPLMREYREAQLAKAARTRERLNNTKWKEVEDIG